MRRYGSPPPFWGTNHSDSISDGSIQAEAEKEFEKQLSALFKDSKEVNNARLVIYSPKTINDKFWERVKFTFVESLNVKEIEDSFSDLALDSDNYSEKKIEGFGGAD